MAQGSADPRVAGASTQVDPAEGSFEQQDSNRSICGSDAGTSSRSNKGKAKVAKVTRRHPTEAVANDKAPGESTELAKRLKAMLEEVRSQVQRDKSNSLMKSTEEVKRPTPEKDTASLAGNLNLNADSRRFRTEPSMEVGSLPEAECLNFRNHMGGDKLDAFPPLRSIRREFTVA